MIYQDTTAIDAVNEGRDTPDAFYNPKHPSELIGRSHWKNTDGWRGYTEIKPEPGYKLAADGCNTGGWSDAPAGTSNNEVEAELNALEAKYGDIFVIWTPTSNVFSTGFDVLVKDAEAGPINRGRVVGHKTRRFDEPDGSWRVRYHATDVIGYDAATDSYKLDTGGWSTMTTAKRMNEFLPGGYYVYRRNWIMYLHRPNVELADIELKDGMSFNIAADMAARNNDKEV